jgi:diguanylate cyclase (GGDEF)-like protein
MVGTLFGVGVVTYAVQERQIERRIIDAHAREHRADAQSLAAISRRVSEPSEMFREINEVMMAIGHRPGVKETRLINERFRVRAAGADERAVGTPDDDTRLEEAIQHGRFYAGHEADPEIDTRDLEFIAPVTLAGDRFAYVMTLESSSLEAELRDARRGLIGNGLLTLLLGGIVFYAAGGRALLRSHRLAVARATLDGLTDLPNQRAFHNDLPAAVKTAKRHGDALTLMLLDADEFKFINDRHGHPHGDQILRRIAAILADGRVGDTCYRIGGDEFALLLPRTTGEGSRARAARLLRLLEDAGLSMSIGIAALNPNGGPDTLEREADAALYEAKRRGGANAVHVDDIRPELAITTTEKLDALHRLLDEERVDVAYQPIWDLERERLLALEALARPHADYGFDGPAEAFDIAEQIAQVPRLDKLCVTRAVRIAPELPDDALLFMNLSPLTLDVSGDDEDWLLHTVTAAGLAPERVVIEVTERFGGRVSAVVKSLQRLKAQGFKVAIDDVGTGNSGLEMLRLLQADYVKLDRSIVAAAPTDSSARAVLMAMAMFAAHTGAFVIAEGIEDADLLRFLGDVADGHYGGDTIIQGGQGYGLGRPSPVPHSGPMPLGRAAL